MLNDSQDSKYWRHWQAVQRANAWALVGGRLHEDAHGEGTSPFHAEVWQEARRLAAAGHHAVTPDDLRHAMTALAAGHPMTHRKMSNPVFDHWLDLTAVLVDPDDLDAVMAWQHPEEGQRRKKIAALLELEHEGVIAHMARSIFKCGDWEKLNVPQLESLRRTLWKRQHDKENVPF